MRVLTSPNPMIWQFLKTAFFALLAAALCSVFTSVSLRSLALPRSCHNFCHFNIKTMRPLAPLQQRAINLHKHTDILIAFLSGTDVCTQATHYQSKTEVGATPTNQEHTLED